MAKKNGFQTTPTKKVKTKNQQDLESTGSAYGDKMRDNWNREHPQKKSSNIVRRNPESDKKMLTAAFKASQKSSWNPVETGKQTTARVSGYTTKSGKKVTVESKKTTWDPVGTGKKTTAKVKSAKRK